MARISNLIVWVGNAASNVLTDCAIPNVYDSEGSLIESVLESQRPRHLQVNVVDLVSIKSFFRQIKRILFSSISEAGVSHEWLDVVWETGETLNVITLKVLQDLDDVKILQKEVLELRLRSASTRSHPSQVYITSDSNVVDAIYWKISHCSTVPKGARFGHINLSSKVHTPSLLSTETFLV